MDGSLSSPAEVGSNEAPLVPVAQSNEHVRPVESDESAPKRIKFDSTQSENNQNEDAAPENDSNGAGDEKNEDNGAEDTTNVATAAVTEGDEKGPATRPVRGEEGFTSEMYKLRVENVHRYANVPDIRKFLLKNGVEAVKIKRNPQWDYMFVTFKDEETKVKSMAVMSTLTYKKMQWYVKDAPMLADPVTSERNRPKSKREQKRSAIEEAKPLPERLNDQVTPLWRKSYPEQLEEKSKAMTEVLKAAKKSLLEFLAEASAAAGDYSWLDKQDTLCPVVDITPSPVQKGYRNKCEFSLGKGEDGLAEVGFVMGLYRDGVTTVVVFREYVRQSTLPIYDRVERAGFWKLLVVRTTEAKKAMIVVQVNPSGVSDEIIAREKSSLTEFFKSKKDICCWESVLFQGDSRTNVGFQGGPCDILLGQAYLEESLLGQKFRISPSSFFQTNTKAAEVLYSVIGDCCTEGNQETVLLDLCCGTGTIGLTLASRVKKVVGVEMVAAAIDDAKVNAKLNNIENVEYHAAKVEDVIDAIIQAAGSAPIVAVVDPPRGGLRRRSLFKK